MLIKKSLSLKEIKGIIRLRGRLTILRNEDTHFCTIHAKLFAIRSLFKCRLSGRGSEVKGTIFLLDKPENYILKSWKRPIFSSQNICMAASSLFINYHRCKGSLDDIYLQLSVFVC